MTDTPGPFPRRRQNDGYELERLEKRVLAAETAQVVLKTEIEAVRTLAHDANRGVTGVNYYLSGDPNRKEDVGRIGELIQEVAALRSRMNTVLGALALTVLAGFFTIAAAIYQTHH